MTPEELQTQLLHIGVASRIAKDEVQVETCRFCGNTRWNLELNVGKGIYHCWACDAGGRLDKLLREWLGGSFHIPVHMPEGVKAAAPIAVAQDFASMPVEDSPLAMREITRRGLSIADVKRYGMVVCAEHGHDLAGRLVIPLHDFWEGVIVGYIGRATVANLRPKYWSTLSVKRITGYRVRSWETPCVLIEGIFDAIAIHRAGFHAAMLSGTSSPDLVQFVARVPPGTPLVVLLDGEAIEEAQRMYHTLSTVHHPKSLVMIPLPQNMDPADFQPQTLRGLVVQSLARINENAFVHEG